MLFIYNQVWHCRDNVEHLAKNHSQWCTKLQLFVTLVRRQAAGNLYMFDMNFGKPKCDQIELNTNDTIEKAVKTVLSDSADIGIVILLNSSLHYLGINMSV